MSLLVFLSKRYSALGDEYEIREAQSGAIDDVVAQLQARLDEEVKKLPLVLRMREQRAGEGQKQIVLEAEEE